MSESFRNASKRLGDLMLRGWTMLSDSCSVLNCNCPLMRSPDGQKYCVNCETWIYPNKKPEPKKFDELFSSKNQMNQEKPKIKEKKGEKKEEKKEEKKGILINEEKKETPHFEINNDLSLVELIENKLKTLGKQLNEENDINKCENIIHLMNTSLDLLERVKKIP